ncbi:MAG: hypothetical protein OJI67_21995 [Prosthecobacter sp.]|nr:hypothetical protein [Prosthecobacter sp.]
MRHTDLSQPFPHHSPEPLMPFTHLRDIATSTCFLYVIIAILVLFNNQVSYVYLYILCALMFLNGIISHFVLRASTKDTFGFRVWSFISQSVSAFLLTFTAYFVVSHSGALISLALLATPYLASSALVSWLVVNQVKRRPSDINKKVVALGPLFGVALASIPLLTTGSIISGVSYLLVATMIFLAVLLLSFDLRAMVWFYRSSRL